MELIGRQLEVGLAVEATRGIATSSAESWVKNITANIIEKAEIKVDENHFGILEDSQNSRVVKKWIEGELSGNLQVDNIGYLFYSLYGAETDSTLTTGVYSHLFELNQSIQNPSLCIFCKDGLAQQLVYKLGVVNTLELSASVDDFVKFSANFIAKESDNTSQTPSYDNERDFIGRDITVKVADTEAGLTGATPIKVKELTVTWENGALNDFVLGSYSPDDIYNAKMSISGSFVKNFEDETFKDLFLNGTAKYMSITIQGETAYSGAYYPKIDLVLNKVIVQAWDRSGANDELVTESIEFKAFYNHTDEEQSTLTLVNETSEYDTTLSA